jgi:Uma2 family endonuclease
LVDGELRDRNCGDVDHSDIQVALAAYLKKNYRDRLWVGVAVRVQVAESRIRVPDVTIVFGPKPGTRIVKEPPHIVVEVLSPEDRAKRIQEKIADYTEFGVPNIWVLDPENRTAVTYSREGMSSISEGSLRATSPLVEVPMWELFQA